MAEDCLTRGGLFVDEITNKAQLVDPERTTLTKALLKQIQDFPETSRELSQILEEVVISLDRMRKFVDAARMDVVSIQSALLRQSGEREKEERELREWIREKRNEVDRRRTYLESLLRQKGEQLELINRMKA